MRTRAFVLSCGRSGSTALATYVKAVEPHFAVRHEPFLWTLLRRMSVRLATGKSTVEQASRLLRILRGAEMRRTRGTYVESTPALWGFTPILESLFPGCVLIHIVRDPFDYVASAVRFKSQSHIKGYITTRLPDLFPAPKDFGVDISVASMTSAERAAWLWGTVNEYILRHTDQHASRIHRFHFESLFGEDFEASEARRLADLLGVRNHDAFLERLRDQPVNATMTPDGRRRSRVSADVLDAVRRHAAPVALRCGYEA